MKGQWVGEYSGTNQGVIIANIDERPSCFEGVVFLNEKDVSLPSTVAFFTTPTAAKKFKFRTEGISPINPLTGLIDLWENVSRFYDGNVVIPEFADVNGAWSDEKLTLSWKTNIGTYGSCVLPYSNANQPSEIIPSVSDWNGFRSSVFKHEGRHFIFRGQNKPWRLRTSFHRAGRFNLHRFVFEDIPTLHKHLSARTKHLFNLDIPNENGAFFNLIQHHGYPTPLLDWSYSPYVAAFFAYRGISSEVAAHAKLEDRVRIYAFNQYLWKKDFNQLQHLLPAGPHVSIGEFLAVENERMIPQQAISFITNMDDIEAYIKSRQVGDKQYLFAIDLPVSNRDKVVQELDYMGVTAGSLFPGLDGACEELKERNFKTCYKLG